MFLFYLNNVKCFSLFVGRQVNNLVNLSVERKLYICCLLISLYNFLSGSCEVDCQGDEKYGCLNYLHSFDYHIFGNIRKEDVRICLRKASLTRSRIWFVSFLTPLLIGLLGTKYSCWPVHSDSQHIQERGNDNEENMKMLCI